MVGKICKDCGLFRPRECFYKDKAKKGGMATYCKECSLIRYREYYKVNGKKIRDTARVWYKKNKVRHSNNNRRWREANKDRHLAKKREAHLRRYNGDVSYKLNHVIRANLSRLAKAVGCDYISCSRVGYDTLNLKGRIECQFKDGMSWGNYGDWEIDHKIPISVMIQKGESRPEKIHMLSNLQPMWSTDNRVKGNRWSG